MIYIIQCSQKKHAAATIGGMRFVANTAYLAPGKAATATTPAMRSREGYSWSDYIRKYNENPANVGLSRAVDIYKPTIYKDMVAAFGAERVFILSAGWGLVPSWYRIPTYEITLSYATERATRRAGLHGFKDLVLDPKYAGEEVTFIGGAAYIGLLCKVLRDVPLKRLVVAFTTKKQPRIHLPLAETVDIVKFPTKVETNWHYQYGRWLIENAGTKEIS